MCIGDFHTRDNIPLRDAAATTKKHPSPPKKRSSIAQKRKWKRGPPFSDHSFLFLPLETPLPPILMTSPPSLSFSLRLSEMTLLFQALFGGHNTALNGEGGVLQRSLFSLPKVVSRTQQKQRGGKEGASLSSAPTALLPRKKSR